MIGEAATIEKLAEKRGISPDRRRVTIKAFNTAIDAGRSHLAGKSPDYVHRRGPYHALNHDVGNASTFPPFFTLSGLRVDEETGAVVDARQRPIGGLYAAGHTVVGVYSNGYFSSGVSWQDCVFSGRRESRSAFAATAYRL